jgi:hypothetical protein
MAGSRGDWRSHHPLAAGARLARRIGWWIPLVGAALLVTGGAWAVSSPPGSSPDDNFHLASIWCAWGEDEDTCRELSGGEETGLADVPAEIGEAACYAFQPTESGACTYQAAARSGFVQTRVNSGLYPDLFYDAMRTLVVSDEPATSVVLMRMANVALASALLMGALVLATPLLRKAVALAWLGTLVPLTVFFLGSTNPTSWVVLGLGTYWAFLLRYLMGEVGRPGTRVAGGFAVASGVMAAGSRADGAAFTLLVTVAILIVALPDWRALARSSMAVPGAVVVIAALVYVTAGQTNASAGLEGIPGTIRPEGLALLLNNVVAYPTLLAGVFGHGWGLGWLDTGMPPVVAALGPAVALSLVVLSATAYWARKLLSVLLVAGVCVALPLFILQQGGNVVGESVQPRYLLPLVVVGLGLALLSRADRSWEFRPQHAVLLTLSVGLANCLALQSNIRRYVTGVDQTSLNLNKDVEWWWEAPVPPMAVWIVGSVAGLALAAGLCLTALGRSRASSPDSSHRRVPAEASVRAGV